MALILLKIIANIMYMGNFFTSNNNSETKFLEISENSKRLEVTIIPHITNFKKI